MVISQCYVLFFKDGYAFTQWKGNPYLGLVVFLAMTFNLVAAGMAGTLIPVTLRALRIDPALASSILLTRD